MATTRFSHSQQFWQVESHDSHLRSYKSLEDYTGYIPFDQEEVPEPLAKVNYKATAQEIQPSRSPDSFYEENKWYILGREGLYRAEIEKALSEIYAHFLKRATDIEIIKDKDGYFYVASRAINNFQVWHMEKMTAQSGKIFFQYGNSPQEIKEVRGIGALCALLTFFDDSDSHSGNIGIINNPGDEYCQVFKIDSEKSFDFDDSTAFEDDFKKGHYVMDVDVTQTESYIRDNEAMLHTVAATDFAIIEDILRRNITSNALAEIQRLGEIDVEGLDPEDYGVNKIVLTLKQRHETLKQKLKIDAVTAPSLGHVR